MKTRNQIDQSIDELLNRIEQECQEEPDTLLSIHPAHYTTEHLFQLRGRWQQRNREYQRLSRIIFAAGVAAPLFFGLGMLGFWSWAILGLIFFPIAATAFMFFLLGSIWLSAKYKSSGYQQAILKAIDEELKERGQFLEEH
ncbi:DUF2892 domain-containing protein [Saprospira sp. CCB-QB6]|uniref:DUF2892 domain-containing protein n=1 Tax=Saprospira sp. CCB-QB6 TaxID=3023936 RepID=UPI00234924FA|nr:DUF2892 domain-containing protein [Saprospira sp. CCB-QB6]WCL82181.1 DUF2892 domain-containing protein [Saprospira sp. CCB-QB6]